MAAFLTTNVLCIPVMGAALPRRSRLIVARASSKSAEHQERPAATADNGALHARGRRRGVMLFGAATALTALTAISGQSARAACLPGGWCDIPDVREPHVQELGEWAVTQHNLQTGSDLQFAAVTSGEAQVVKGMNYRLVIQTKKSGRWGATLFDPLPGGKLELNQFNRLPLS